MSDKLITQTKTNDSLETVKVDRSAGQSNIIIENYKRVQGNIADACGRVNRDPNEVTTIAVSKTFEVEAIETLLDLGHQDFGESKAQELVAKHDELSLRISQKIEPPSVNPKPAPTRPRWHMIGHLQRNKVKPILKFVNIVHSVDSLRLAEEINTAAARQGIEHRVKVFMQVNTSKEKSKFGLAVGALTPLTEQVATLPNIEIVGLMTMAPLTDDKDKIRFCFGRCQEIFEEMKGEKVAGPGFKHLSMGMSQDYEIAVECGATMVRVGTGIFGQRVVTG